MRRKSGVRCPGCFCVAHSADGFCEHCGSALVDTRLADGAKVPPALDGRGTPGGSPDSDPLRAALRRLDSLEERLDGVGKRLDGLLDRTHGDGR